MITTQFIKMFNKLINEYIVQARAVNTQTVGFNDWCIRMANGSTVTAADVAAVMQQIEDKLPEILSLNAKVICSPGGLTFRPKVSGSITQSELKARLIARKAAETDPEKAAKINPDRALTTGDLAISDCSVSIEVDLPKDWSDTFKRRAELKRVKSSGNGDDSAEENDDQQSGDNGQGSSDNGQGSSDNGQQGGGQSSGQQTSDNGEGTGGSGQQTGGNSETVAAPTVSGTTPFEETTTVTMSGPAGAEIHYTTDGSAPSSESTLYSTALTLSDTTTVKAVAVKDGVLSSVTTKTFVKGSGGNDDPNNSED